MAQVVTRLPSQADSSPHSYSKQKQQRHASSSSSSSPSKNDKVGGGTFNSSKKVQPRDDGVQNTIKQSNMLHFLLSEPVRFVKSNDKHGQDYSTMGLVPVNDPNYVASAKKKSVDGSLLFHTDSPKINGTMMASSEAGPSTLSPSSSSKSSNKHSRDFYPFKVSLRFPSSVRQIAPGLNNYGNTCYMNSVMQSLIHTPSLAYALLTNELQALHGEWGGKPNANFDAVVAMQAFAKRSLLGNKPTNAPQEFNKNLKAFAKPLRQGRQEDAHEYLRFLLEAMQQACLARAPKAFKPDDPARQTTFVQKIFGGKLRSRVTCLNCKHNSDTFDPFMDLSLDVRKGINSLTDAFRAFVAKDKLTGSEKYKCDNCKRRVDATKQFTIESTPPALTIHLKRFTVFGGKVSRQIDFDDSINIAPYLSVNPGSAKYKLYAIVHHYGSGPNCGHYVASVKSPSGKWTRMDDSHVSDISRQNPAGDQSAYILFYLREKDAALEQAIRGDLGVSDKLGKSTGFSNSSEQNTILKRKNLKRTQAESDLQDQQAPVASKADQLLKYHKQLQKGSMLAQASQASSMSLQNSPEANKKQKLSKGLPTQALDDSLISKPKSAASFHGSTDGAISQPPTRSLLGFGNDDDELGTSVNRDEYESLVGGPSSTVSSGSSSSTLKVSKSSDPELETDQEEQDENESQTSASIKLPSVQVALSKKERRKAKKAAAVVSAKKKGIPGSPYALANISSFKLDKNPHNKLNKKVLNANAGTMASKMKPRS